MVDFLDSKDKNPSGYYDPIEPSLINRDFEVYKGMLFRDSSEKWLKELPEGMSPQNPGMWSLRQYHRLEHKSPKKTGPEHLFDLELPDGLFGGIQGFFSDGVRILDLGSGHGKAVGQINEKYKDKGIVCEGLDFRYGRKDYPEGSRNLIAGNFSKLPFCDNTYDRFMGVESFPLYLPVDDNYRIDPQQIQQYIIEITRVAKQGALWRATKQQNTMIHVGRLLLDNGWEYYDDLGNDYFAAKLIDKKS